MIWYDVIYDMISNQITGKIAHFKFPMAKQIFGIKESGDSIKQLLQYLKHGTYKWIICADLKVIALLLGLQLG